MSLDEEIVTISVSLRKHFFESPSTEPKELIIMDKLLTECIGSIWLGLSKKVEAEQCTSRPSSRKRSAKFRKSSHSFKKPHSYQETSYFTQDSTVERYSSELLNPEENKSEEQFSLDYETQPTMVSSNPECSGSLDGMYAGPDREGCAALNSNEHSYIPENAAETNVGDADSKAELSFVIANSTKGNIEIGKASPAEATTDQSGLNFPSSNPILEGIASTSHENPDPSIPPTNEAANNDQVNGKFVETPSNFGHQQLYENNSHEELPRHKCYCPDCGQGFRHTGTLQQHIKYIHNPDNPFCCKLCGHNFYSRANLHAHYLTHTGHKPWMCSLCRSPFRLKAHVRGHLRNVHKCLNPDEAIVDNRMNNAQDVNYESED